MFKIIFKSLLLLFPILFSEVFTPMLIPYFHKLKFGQVVREEGPKSHFEKQGTPTFGGLIFIAGATLAIYMINGFTGDHNIVVLAFVLFGILGFLDDYIKVVLKRNLGLRAYQKLIGQFVIGLLIAYLTYESGRVLQLPFTSATWDMGMLYYPVVVLFLMLATNSTNPTDGLDGLLSGTTIMASAFLIFVTYILKNTELFYAVLALDMALLAFLRFNKNPAKIFMGDTGSLAIGGFLATTAIITGTTIFAIVFGGVFLAEAISVILQVGSYKLRKKRIFKMAPLHHHYELLGHSETSVVKRFWIASLVLSVLAILIY